MYSHISADDHKNIAGIAYLQSKLKELDPEIKIDGMFGAESIAAFRDAIEKGMGIEDFRVDLQSTGMGLIQNMIRQAAQVAKRKDFPIGRLHDNQWGDGTKAAIDLILGEMCFLKQLEKAKESLVDKRSAGHLSEHVLNHVRNRIGRSSLTPLTYEESGIPKQGTHWCSGMEYEVNEQTDKLLAKAMGYENPVVTIHQMLAAKYQIALEYYRGRAVGVIVVRPFEVIPPISKTTKTETIGAGEGKTSTHGMIEGIYVNKNIRGAGVGTRLLVAAKFKCEELGYDRIVFVRGPATHSLEDTLDGVRNPKERIFDQLINGHGYRPVMTALDASRAERCVRDLNKQ